MKTNHEKIGKNMLQQSLTSKERQVVLLVFAALMVCSAFLLLRVPNAAAQQVTARLNPESFSTQEPARLTITVEGKQKADITVPEIDGLIFHQRGKSSQFQMINGESSSSVTYTYLVQGVTPGNYTIPPISVATKDGTHKTDPIRCSVSGTPSAPPGQKQNALPSTGTVREKKDDSIAFLKTNPVKKNAYLGERIPTTIEAYFNRGVKINLNALPVLKSDGFLIDTLSNEPEQREVTINDEPYVSLTWQTALTAIKEGTHEISMEMDATMLVRARQQQMPGFGGGLFQDDFMNDFFARYENRPIRITSPAVSVFVQQVPEQGRPEGFNGAIGSFALHVTAQPTRIDQGDPITMTITVTGSGNFDSVSTPLLTDDNGIKIYPPSASMNKDEQTGNAQKRFEQAVVITDGAISHIPPAVFSFFDPDRKEFQTLFTDPIPVEITTPLALKPTASAQKEPPSASAEQLSQTQPANQPFAALAPVKLTIGPVISRITPVFKQPLYLSICVLLILCIGGVTAIRVRKHYLVKNPEVIRLRKINAQRRRMVQLFDDARLLDDKTYLEKTQRALQEFLALIWQKEPTALTTADVENRLGRRSPVTQLFTLADQASYGAAHLPVEQREKIHKSVKELLQSLS